MKVNLELESGNVYSIIYQLYSIEFMNVTLRQMRLFCSVAQELSFTAAAQRANITQSALTSAIRSLEAELGLKLFDRTTRRVSLTVEGEHFLATAERLLGDIDASLENVRSVAARTRGHVTLSSAYSFLGYVACPAVVILSKTHPGVTVRLVEKRVDEAIAAVLGGELDFAVCGLVSPNPEIASVTVVRDRFGIVATPEVMARHGARRWADLDPAHYVALASTFGIRQLIDRHRPLGEYLRQPHYEVASTISLGLLLKEGIGYGLVPAMTAQPFVDQGLVFQPLDEPALFRELHIIKRRNRGLSPAAAALVERFAPIMASIPRIDGAEIMLDEASSKRFVES
ncbi:LysR family transcriptional regulator [Burkholderiaceae bacterium FT117]|uniref:LysR family transcriptional regulator n=1 Tax=Zeimonas sediminis TaxID=2944268 RepID=UPI002343185B|nr:LysR family transcriptional regulator [Zeimonas sediminis]MCM5571764.1 LysR family transcriptional regulator [Zeimonas sediminis]